MAVHKLKTWSGPFQAVADGRKRFEFRKNDRGFEVGDILRLKEWDPKILDIDHEIPDKTDSRYTGREVEVSVLYVARGPDFDIPEGYIVMSIGMH